MNCLKLRIQSPIKAVVRKFEEKILTYMQTLSILYMRTSTGYM